MKQNTVMNKNETKMNNTDRNGNVLVSNETAKLLKLCGFNLCVYNFYNSNGLLCEAVGSAYDWNSETGEYQDTSAPSQSLAQKWLREVKGIEVYAHVFYDSREMLDEWDVYVYEVNHITKHIEDYISSYDIFHTYEEAQEAGIKKVLELILKKGNNNYGRL